MQSIYIELLGPGKVGLLDKKEGGFAEVLILANERGAPSHAFKILKQCVESPESVVAEVSALSRLPAHPHVVEVEGYSSSDVGPGILLPFYPSNLRSVMQSGLELREKLVIAEQLLRGLQHIHANGILHLDLKPDNVLISAKRDAAVSDFGISKLVEKPDLEGNPTLKVSLPNISGTLLYMAPEQLARADVSVKTDIFSFGVLLYELVVGRLPWDADTVQDYARCILYTHERFGLTERVSIPAWLQSTISACLAKAPSARPTVDTLLQSFLNEGFHQTVALDDEDLAIREVNRASVLAMAGKCDEATQILGNILRSNPWNLTARINLAELMFIMGRAGEAIASARLSLQLAPWGGSDAPSTQVLYLNLALYLMTEDPREAYRVTSHALERFPDNWELMHNHAEACRLVSIDCADRGDNVTQKIQEGLRFAERALSFRPDDTPLQVTYAGLLRLSGDREKFIPYINQLLHDAGSYSVATRLLFIDALIDEGELSRASDQISELATFEEFSGLLDEKKLRLARLRSNDA
ncbi:protein kinase domain-containing protein [Metallibacterium scheffleri]